MSQNTDGKKTKKELFKEEMRKTFASFFSTSEQFDAMENFDTFKNPGQEAISDLEEHMKMLEKKMDRTHRDGFEKEFETLLHYELLLQRNVDLFKSAHEKFNSDKNRYVHVLPNEKTRIHLIYTQEEAELLLEKQCQVKNNDYINANFIPYRNDGLLSPTYNYIATQCPMYDETSSDFWRMTISKNVSVILCLTDTAAFEDKGTFEAQHKPLQYWPNVGDTFEHIFNIDDKKYEKYSVKTEFKAFSD